MQSNNIETNLFGAKTFSTNTEQKVLSNSVNGNLSTNFNAKDPFASMSGVPAQPKKQININDLWGNFTQDASKAQILA